MGKASVFRLHLRFLKEGIKQFLSGLIYERHKKVGITITKNI
jgi:hypothetical protein